MSPGTGQGSVSAYLEALRDAPREVLLDALRDALLELKLLREELHRDGPETLRALPTCILSHEP